MLPIARLTSRRLATLALRHALRPAAVMSGAAAANTANRQAMLQMNIRSPRTRFFSAGADDASWGATASQLEENNSEGTPMEDIVLDPVPSPNSEFANLKPIEEYGLSDTMMQNLQQAGFTHLFPIQAESYEVMKNGTDVIGRSKTGSGKTLAFALPIVERLLEQARVRSSSSLSAPRAVVLLPTRELAQQVAKETKRIAPQLRVLDVVGGVPYDRQESALRRGVDILVGTPGRIMDLVDKRRVLSLREVQVAVLDEADMMLKFGFADDVETILGWMPEERQTAMWSATFPKWVNSLARRFTNDATKIDLVGDQDNNVPTTVAHKAIHSPLRSRINVLVNVLRRGSYDGKTLVFTETKQEANDITIALDMPGVRALHGDLSQALRQQTMDDFRSGKIKTLVCTDIAARGLDIANVDRVVQFRLPHDKESFVHRAGRTGRAGRSGTSIVFFDHQDYNDLMDLEARYNVSFKHMAPPHLSDVVGAVVDEVEKKMARVPAKSSALFLDAANRMFEAQGIDAFSKVLTLLGGMNSNVGTASMLTGQEDMQTVEVTGVKSVNDLRQALNNFDSKKPIQGFYSVDDKIVFDIELHAFEKLKLFFESLESNVIELKPATELSKVLFNNRTGTRSRDQDDDSRHFKNRNSRNSWGGDNRGNRYSRRSSGRNDRWSSNDRKPRGNFLEGNESSRQSSRGDRSYRTKDWTDEF